MDGKPTLASAFLQRLEGKEASAATADLEASLRRLVTQGEAAWPGVHVDPLHFVAYLAERLPAGDDPIAALQAINAAGLYVACACASGDSSAVAAVDTRFLADVDRVLGRMAAEPGFADDVKQQVRAKLFVPEPGGRPKIADYLGQGDLQTFLRVMLVRQAISLRRKDRREVLTGDSHRPAADAWVSADPELLHLRHTYEAEFQRVFREAIRGLSSEERNLLRYHYLDGLNIDHIGAIYGIHRVSAARRLTKVREKLVLETRRLLAERLRLRTGELESILRLIESEVDISMRRVLGEPSAKA